MADDEVDRFLFLDETGKPVHFYMPPCPERNKLKPIIENGGGQISNKIVPGCIKLAVPGQKVRSSDLIQTKYVTDSVEKGELLDVEEYRIPADTVASDEGDVVSDIDMEIDHVDHIMHVPPRAKKGRTKYLLSEDLKIVRYILEEELYNETSGKAMWEHMQILKIVNHSWQSMKDRFKKQILPNIRSYQLTSREIALLTQTSATDWDDEKQSDPRSPDKTSPSVRPTESSPPKKKARHASESNPADTTPTVMPDVPVGLDNFDLELVALAQDEDAQDMGNDKGPAPSANKEPTPSKDKAAAPCNDKGPSPAKGSATCTQETSELSKVKGPAPPKEKTVPANRVQDSPVPSQPEEPSSSLPASTTATATTPAVTSTEIIHVENERKSPTMKNISEDSDDDLILELPSKSPVKTVAKPTRRTEVVSIDESDEAEQSQSVLLPPNTRGRRALRSGDGEVPGTSTSNNNAATASTEGRGTKRTAKSKVNYLKDFVCDLTSSQPETQQSPASPGSQALDEQHLQGLEKKIDKVCRWLSIRREELLDTLWTTSGSLDDAVNWILSGGSDRVPVWTPEDDEMLHTADERDLSTLEQKFGSPAVTARLSFTS